jgi:hypothetical protein
MMKRGNLSDTIAGLAKLNNTRKAREICAQAGDGIGLAIALWPTYPTPSPRSTCSSIISDATSCTPPGSLSRDR